VESATIHPYEQEEGLPMKYISSTLYCLKDCLKVVSMMGFSAELGIYQADYKLGY